jgi:uncharacterized RDD family membrane protein YckC
VDGTALPTDLDWRAGMGTRFAARLVDGLVVGVPAIVLVLLTVDLDADRLSAEGLELPFWVSGAIILLAALYEIGLVALYGQTLGKRLLRIQVVDVGTGRPPDLGGATIRYLVPAVPSLVPGVGGVIGLLVYASALWSPARQGWHDRAAGTVVVRTAARQAVTGGWADPDVRPDR